MDPYVWRNSLNRRQCVQGMGVVSLGLLLACGRLPFQGQVHSTPTVHRIGYLTLIVEPESRIQRFRDGLGDLGWMDGQNIVIDEKTAYGQSDRLDKLAAELVGVGASVIVASGTVATAAARNATSTVPIIMVNAGDPVTTGLVSSLSQPGGNVTGLTNIATELSAKRLQLLQEGIPGLTHVTVLWHRAPASEPALRETQDAAQTLGINLELLEMRGEEDIDGALQTALQQRTEAVLVLPSPIFGNLAARPRPGLRRLPGIYPALGWVQRGGLMFYGPDIEESFRRAAYYVDRVLKGAKPADLPVERPRTFNFVINLQTAQELGLTIPQHMLVQATELIQ